MKRLPKSKAELSVSIPWEEWQEEIGHAVEHLSKSVKIEGFRSGKIPREVLEKKLGKATVLIEGAEHAIDHLFPKVIHEAKVDAIGKPEIRLDDVNEGESLCFTVTTDIMPEAALGGWEKAARPLGGL